MYVASKGGGGGAGRCLDRLQHIGLHDCIQYIPVKMEIGSTLQYV